MPFFSNEHQLFIKLSILINSCFCYRLRNANDFRHALSRTQLYYRSFVLRSIRAWKDLSLVVRQSNSIQSLKYQLNKNLKKPPKYFYIGDRISQIQHNRLRTDCSSLNNHLIRKIFLTVLFVPVVQLKLQSTTFIECQMYKEIRAIMLNKLANYCAPDLNTVLFCITASDFNTYYRIIITVQEYTNPCLLPF